MYFLVLEFCVVVLFTFYATLRYVVTSQLKVVAETGVPVENHQRTPCYWQLSHLSWPGKR